MSAEKTHRSWDNLLASGLFIAFGVIWFASFWRVPIAPGDLMEVRRVARSAPELHRGAKGSRSIEVKVLGEQGAYFISDYVLKCTEKTVLLRSVQVGDTLMIGVRDPRSTEVYALRDHERSYIDLEACIRGSMSDRRWGLIIGPVIVLVTLLFWFLKRRLPFLK
ncbi:MAG: hypothetical protein IPF41_09560 [Flavobacteriales bacterium]|nr:hypothetical protein [Flavobacteriales bacterium]